MYKQNQVYTVIIMVMHYLIGQILEINLLALISKYQYYYFYSYHSIVITWFMFAVQPLSSYI